MLPVIIRIASSKKLFVPRQYRMVHPEKVSSLGGIAIFTGVLFVTLFFSDFEDFKEIKYFLAAGSFIFLVGLRDDLKKVRPFDKLIGQIAAASIIIFLGGLRIEYIESYNEIFHIPHSISYLISIAVFIWFINAYNFFDGIDLQASLNAVVILIPLGFWFYLTSQYNFSLLLMATAGSLFAFIFFNYSPSKIFMGDTGTITIGFILAFAFIKFINLNTENLAGDFNIQKPIVYGILAFILPLSDSLRVVFTRIFRGSSPFLADKNHLHHLLIHLKWKQNNIAFFTTSYTTLSIIINFFLVKHLESPFIVLILNIIPLIILYTVIYSKLKSLRALKINDNQ